MMEEETITKDDVLALDIATHTGYFSTHGHGTWDFTESMHRNGNKQHAAFRNTLIDFIGTHGIKRVVAEDVSVNAHFFDIRKLAEFRGILLEVCDTLDIPEPVFFNPSTIKKFATGNGAATKEEMVAACRQRWKTEPVDDNEADAAHIFFCYVKRLKL